MSDGIWPHSYYLDVWRCVRYIFEKIFAEFLDIMSQRERNKDREEELEQHLHLLLIKFNHIQEKIRRVADKYISLLSDK